MKVNNIKVDFYGKKEPLNGIVYYNDRNIDRIVVDGTGMDLFTDTDDDYYIYKNLSLELLNVDYTYDESTGYIQLAYTYEEDDDNIIDITGRETTE